MPPHYLDLLWERVEEARLKWKSAHGRVNEVSEEGGSSAGGTYGHLHPLRVQKLAVGEYLRALQEFMAALESREEPATAQPNILTQREQEVLALIVSGKSSKEVAAGLGISFRTAVSHRYHIYKKLNVHTNVELTRVAIRMGLIER